MLLEATIRSRIRTVLRESNRRAYRSPEAKKAGGRWPMDAECPLYATTLETFQRLGALQDGKTFDDLVAARLSQRKSMHVADFFGSGLFLTNPTNASSITGIRLEKLMPSYLPQGYPNPVWEEIEGNLYNDSWIALKKNMRARNINTFDLIVSRPGAGLTSRIDDQFVEELFKEDSCMVLAYMTVHWRLLQKAYALLSSDNGEMYVAANTFLIEDPLLAAWAAFLQLNGVSCEVFLEKLIPFDPMIENNPNMGMGAIKIVKTKESPAQLPGLDV